MKLEDFQPELDIIRNAGFNVLALIEYNKGIKGFIFENGMSVKAYSLFRKEILAAWWDLSEDIHYKGKKVLWLNDQENN